MHDNIWMVQLLESCSVWKVECVCYNAAMRNKVRFICLLVLFLFFLAMLGYSFYVYSSEKPYIRRTISTKTPTPTINPTRMPSKSYNMIRATDLLGFLVPTIVQQQVRHAGQSATPNMSEF